MRDSLKGVLSRVKRLIADAALAGCGGQHQHYRIVYVHENEPVPAWPEAEVGERCCCGATFRYDTMVHELVGVPHLRLPELKICW